MGDSETGKIGEAELDMGLVSINEPKVIRLNLKFCADDTAFIEVALKGTEVDQSMSASTPKSSGKGTVQQEADKVRGYE